MAGTRSTVVCQSKHMGRIGVVRAGGSGALFGRTNGGRTVRRCISGGRIFVLGFGAHNGMIFGTGNRQVLAASRHVRVPGSTVIICCGSNQRIPTCDLAVSTGMISFGADGGTGCEPVCSTGSRIFVVHCPSNAHSVLAGVTIRRRRRHRHRTRGTQLGTRQRTTITSSVGRTAMRTTTSRSGPGGTAVVAGGNVHVGI